MGGDHRLLSSDTHVLHPVSVRQLVSRRHDETATVDGIAEKVAVGLVVVARLLMVWMMTVAVDRRL